MKKPLLALALALGTLPAIAAPAADAIPKHLDATLPDDIRYAHQAAQMETIAYTPVEAPLHYLDAKRQPADKPVKDGYYRKELGKTADGRLVVQHFYQNSDKPASAPFLLKKDAAPDSGMENADGKIVQYQKDGSIFAVETRRDGKAAGRTNYYENGRLFAQTTLPAGMTEKEALPLPETFAHAARLYYPDGKIMLASDDWAHDNGAALAYRQDGSLLYTRIIQADGTPQITLWDAAGNPLQAGAAYQKAEKEVLRITKKRKYFAQVIAALFPEQH